MSRVDAHLREAVAARVLDDADVAAAPTDRSRLRAAVARALAAEGVVVSPTRWAQLVRDLVDELGGLGALEPLLRDPAVTDVMVNGPDEVWVERDGRLGYRFTPDVLEEWRQATDLGHVDATSESEGDR